MVIGIGRRGLMAAVNSIAEYAELAEADGQVLAVVGPRSLYFDPERGGNPWLYYFEPVFPRVRLGPKPPEATDRYLEQIGKAARPLTPRMIWGVQQGMELPADRHRGAAVLTRYIRLRADVLAKIDDFANAHFTGPVIGAHIRGPGGVHGGAKEMRDMLDPDSPVPFGCYFQAIDAALVSRPDAALFVCSDSQWVIDKVQQRYGERMITYPACRSVFGEMHENHPANKGQTFSPYQLGLDVLTEAHLLARCDHFVHGLSSVANYILCRAPDMPHTYVYAEVEQDMRRQVSEKFGGRLAGG